MLRVYLFKAITGFFIGASSVQPMLLILDDLHAADDPSMLLLKFLARDLRGAHLLVVGIYRDVEAERPPPGIGDAVGELVREGQLVSLRGLDREDVKVLIEGLSGVVPSEAKVATIHEATEGNRCPSGKSCACWPPRPLSSTPAGSACRSPGACGR